MLAPEAMPVPGDEIVRRIPPRPGYDVPGEGEAPEPAEVRRCAQRGRRADGDPLRTSPLLHPDERVAARELRMPGEDPGRGAPSEGCKAEGATPIVTQEKLDPRRAETAGAVVEEEGS